VFAYTVRRILQGILVLIAVSILTFMLPAMFHGDVARAVLGQRATMQEVAKLNRQLGYDHPLVVQYWRYIWGLLHGNFGKSVAKQSFMVPVSSIISSGVWRTVWLATISLIFAVAIAIPLGLVQALRRNSLFDYTVTGLVFLVYSTPAFLLGILLIAAFSIHWSFFPPFVVNSPGTGVFGPLMDILRQPREFVLPVAVLTGLTVGGFTRYMRSSVLDSLVQDYVRTARAKGASNARVLFRHSLRNALIPIVTIMGLTLPGLFGGALITETLFNYPGMGLVTVQAVENNDINTVMAATLIIALATIAGNLLADLGLSLVDPRVRLGGKK
jgi:peptide/nickel transport system permease protein